ncbi:MAG TPA: DUF1801 domain-containing protein [Planctomycetota bacterium]|nr:DUF1801 domain-containing protein [Planctomycetota bacterium]
MAKMKSYPTFDHYLADQSPRNRAILRELRALVKKTAPKLEESVKWSNGCWLKGKVPVAYVYADKAWVQFGFMLGSRLEDPRGLLEGSGQYVRHVKVLEAGEIHERALAALLRQAIAITPESFAELSASTGRKTSKARKATAKRAKKSPARKRS